MRKLITTLIILIPTSLYAQGIPTSYNYEVYIGTTITPTSFRSLVIPVTPTLCGQPQFPTPPICPLTNPTRIIWSDPADVTKICIADITSFFRGLPDNTYVSTISASNASGASGRSTATCSFLVSGIPLVPANPQVR